MMEKVMVLTVKEMVMGVRVDRNETGEEQREEA